MQKRMAEKNHCQKGVTSERGDKEGIEYDPTSGQVRTPRGHGDPGIGKRRFN